MSLLPRLPFRARQIALLAAIAWLGFGCAPEVQAGAKPAASEANDLFTGTNICRIEIEIPDEGMARLRPYHWIQGNPMPKPEATAVVREGGRVYSNVVVHPKGAMGSFRPIDTQPALTLNFDKLVDGQKFHGLTKISLNNSVQDHTYIKERLCRELFNEIGVPAPRSDFAFVTLNGRDLGLYVLLEGANKHFLKQHFQDTSGTLYDGGFCQDITAPLEITYGNRNNDRSDLRALADATRIQDPSRRFATMSRLLDMERFINMLALETLLCDWDCYAQNRNNYRIYHDPATDRLVFIVHGLDLTLQQVQNSLFPNMQGMVARAVIATPEGRTRYAKRIREYHNTLFQPEALFKRIDRIEAKLRGATPSIRIPQPAQPNFLPPLLRFSSGPVGPASQLRDLIRRRHAFVTGALESLPE